MNFCFSAAPFPRSLILARRIKRKRERARELRKQKKSPFWGMKWGLADTESSIIVQSLPKEGDIFSYNGTTGIVIDARAEYPPDDFPKSIINVKINP